MTTITAVVEGALDEAVIRRLISDAGGAVARIIIAGGRANLLGRISGYANAARFEPWIILCDLDQDECAPSLLNQYASAHPSTLCFRIAVRSVESWLLADPALARILDISDSLLPKQPDAESHPKQTLIQLARRSRTRTIREQVGGDPDLADPGTLYTKTLSEFVESDWNPQRAAQRSPSLQRTLNAVQHLANP